VAVSLAILSVLAQWVGQGGGFVMSAIPVIYALAATYLIVVVVPMVVYGIFAARFRLDQPEAKARFFAVGTAVGFVGLFELGSEQSWWSTGSPTAWCGWRCMR
jgi:hypothetical protein